jgi:glycosyltransferase involved in cell wall biosynthesis
MASSEEKCIAFLWSGLPDYAARLIGAYVNGNTCKVLVIATPPSVPIHGMEQSLGQKIHWIENNSIDVSWQSLGCKIPDLVFQGGWARPGFDILAAQARERGAKIILMNDQDWTGSFVQRVVDPMRHRFKYHKRFDGVFTAGRLGVRYHTMMGYDPKIIFSGLYGADPSLFGGGRKLTTRPKTFLFVGQLIERKNILALTQAFLNMSSDCPEWTLRICGDGALRSELPEHPKIQIEGFVQPEALSMVLQSSRCLVLPSFQEHWGLVVHEAALSGCALALSNRIGSRQDLCGEKNAVLFSPQHPESLESALRSIASWNDGRWDQAEIESRQLATGFGPDQFRKSVEKFVDLSASQRAF